MILCREVESHFQPITRQGGVLGTAMSSWPGVVRDPENTLIQDFASISRPASAAPRAFVQRRGAGLHPVHRDHVSGQAGK